MRHILNILNIFCCISSTYGLHKNCNYIKLNVLARAAKKKLNKLCSSITVYILATVELQVYN